jgi:hypothetical protein
MHQGWGWEGRTDGGGGEWGGCKGGVNRVEEGLIEENPGSVLQHPILNPFRFLDEFSTIFQVLVLVIGEKTYHKGQCFASELYVCLSVTHL